MLDWRVFMLGTRYMFDAHHMMVVCGADGQCG
jgi:hypothetical protein